MVCGKDVDSMAQWNLTEAIEYYEKAGAARDQQLLTEFLREVQRENGGVIPKKCITEAAEKMGIRETFFYALIKRYPSLCLEDTPNRLEICGGPVCGKSRILIEQVKKKYHIDSNMDGKSDFSLHITGCMKNCRCGPNIRWNGVQYSQASIELIDSLLKQEKNSK